MHPRRVLACVVGLGCAGLGAQERPADFRLDVRPFLARYCGRNFPPVITSSEGFLWLRFSSDETIEYSGFRGVYQFLPDIGQFLSILLYFTRFYLTLPVRSWRRIL